MTNETESKIEVFSKLEAGLNELVKKYNGVVFEI